MYRKNIERMVSILFAREQTKKKKERENRRWHAKRGKNETKALRALSDTCSECVYGATNKHDDDQIFIIIIIIIIITFVI